ncbi:MAG: neutral/alkaline non-lysosomal ceramidase N-terminal domain-containing protein [Acidobacteria bacterium]|nr:neutral/alkaline non-lysosomal ceramidase N-terminal domain-containing protein [Acidobacteriota bacterium]
MRKTVLLLFVLLVSNAVSVHADELRVGVAAVSITPPDGTPLSGYYRKRLSEGVLDDIHAKAIVFEQNGTKAALVVCDILTLPRHTILTARQLIKAHTGIPEENVLISATHSHTSPVVSGENTRDALDGGDTEAAKTYTANLPKLIAQSVAEANRKLAPTRVSATIAHEDGVSFNRRFWMRDGTVSWNPPKQDRNIVKPAGPIDPEVGFLYFETPQAQPLASFVNFALHLDTTGGQKISSDYPGHLARLLAEYKGKDFQTIFATGACGNINHRDIAWKDNQKGVNEAFRIATALAGAINQSWSSLKPLTTATLQVRSEVIKLPTAPITSADVAKAKEVYARMSDPKTTFSEQVNAFKVLDIVKRQGQPLEVEVQVIAIGNELAFVSLPGEVFVELGQSIKKASPFAHTMIVELANGSIGYIPNRSAYTEGNYEVWSARCAEGSGEMLVTTALKLLSELSKSKPTP